MITDTIEAWQADTGDCITLGGDDVFEVVECDTDTSGTSLTLRNDEGEYDTFYFNDTDELTLVVSLDSDD